MAETRTTAAIFANKDSDSRSTIFVETNDYDPEAANPNTQYIARPGTYMSVAWAGGGGTERRRLYICSSTIPGVSSNWINPIRLQSQT